MRTQFLFFCFLFTLTSMAQAPARMTFQAVVRDASNELVVSSPVGIRISILQGSENGSPVYVETHVPESNPLGLVSLEVGGGAAVLGSFEDIDWSLGPYFLRTESDATGGTDYTISGTQQLLSVPYALYATSSGSVASSSSLDDAYDAGGLGTGRTITADAGAVEVNAAGGTTTALQVNSAVPNSTAIRAEHTGIGVGVRAASLNSTNPFAAIQATTNSVDANNSAIIGNNDGAGYGVSGQIPATATGTAAVYGSNLRSNGGSGVTGIGFNGVVGQAQNAGGYGVYGINSNAANGTTTLGIGTYGLGFNGVYGQTTNVTQGWAGYFTADVGVDGTGFALGGWVNASDARLKRDVRPIDGALARVRLLDGRRYLLETPSRDEQGNILLNSRPQYGLIAQDIEALFPELVHEKALFINHGDETMYKTVDYIQLVPVLIEAIKELSAEVDRLREEVERSR